MKKTSLAFICIPSAFFASGVASLLYETLWVKTLTIVFGHTALAVAGVLCAYMAGLCIGSLIGGRFADKLSPRSLLILFIALEIGTAVTGLLSHSLLLATQRFIVQAGALHGPLWAQTSLWFAVSFFFLAIPATLMGATLPLLVQWANRDYALSILYGANLAGAVCGTVLAGFWCVPALGITGTFVAAALCNVFAAGIASFASLVAPGNAPPPGRQPQEASSPASSFPAPALYAMIVIAGAAAMVCEVAWARAFALILGSSTYSFSLMLLIFLAGLALGSIGFGLFRLVFTPTIEGFSCALALLAVLLLAYLPVTNILPFLFVKLFPLALEGKLFLHLVQLLLCASIILAPASLMGMLFPWAAALARPAGRPDSRRGSSAGTVYALSTIGNIIGSAVTGLVLLPLAGAERSLLVAVILYTAASLIGIVAAPLRRTKAATAASLLLISLIASGIVFRPPWDPYLFSSGAFLYAPEYFHLKTFREFKEHLHQPAIIFHQDGLSSTVTVFESPWGERFLRVNGKTDASSGNDMSTQLLLSYLPVLYHQGNPKTALVIGLGSGVTAGALVASGSIDSITCVEIEPALSRAAAFFSDVNHGILNDPRFHLLTGDARQHLASTKKQYDLIVSEPSNPWIEGVASLFTKEAFHSARERLSPGGVFCQWFHSYAMKESDFRMIVQTFVAVFPHAVLLTTTENDFLLLGTNAPWRIDYRNAEKLFNANETAKKDLSLIGLHHPFALLSTTFLLQDKELRGYASGAPLHCDDRPVLEYSAPYYLYKDEKNAIASSILSSKVSFLPEGIEGLDMTGRERETLYNISGEAFLRLQQLRQAEQAIREASKLSDKNARTWTNLGRIHFLKENLPSAETAFRKALAADPGYALAWFHLGMLSLYQGREKEGLLSLEKGLELSPGDPMGSLHAGRLYMKLGRTADAKKLFTGALARPVASAELRSALTSLLGNLDAPQR